MTLERHRICKMLGKSWAEQRTKEESKFTEFSFEDAELLVMVSPIGWSNLPANERRDAVTAVCLAATRYLAVLSRPDEKPKKKKKRATE